MVAEVVSSPMRRLRDGDLDELLALTAADPVVHTFMEHRLRTSSLDSPWFGGEVWGWFVDGELRGGCHAATIVIPFGELDDTALGALALRVRRKVAASIVGPEHLALALWECLRPAWGPARSVRAQQPLLVIDDKPDVAPDPRVRHVTMDEFEIVYPACVQMFTEEVGSDPELGNRDGYRARVSHLIAQGWAFAIIEDGEVLFKAEVGAATPAACQVQGVYVAPRLRGTGLATPAMAGVVRLARETIAPRVSLYVNDYNLAARRVYEKVGFTQHGTFATILM